MLEESFAGFEGVLRMTKTFVHVALALTLA
jgi:hypothetical protein